MSHALTNLIGKHRFYRVESTSRIKNNQKAWRALIFGQPSNSVSAPTVPRIALTKRLIASFDRPEIDRASASFASPLSPLVLSFSS